MANTTADKTNVLKLECGYGIDLSTSQKLNPDFSRVKIRVAYHGKNRNNSYISKELLQAMAETSLKNVPIVGFWREDVNNFGGHSKKLEISDEGFKVVDLTKPIGVIPENTELSWETLREKDGYTEHEYLCCTGILWSGRYEECEKILDDGSNQSMEIVLDKYHYDDDDVMVIDDAHFSALCVLGKDKDPDINVEPCFEQAGIESYSLDDFKAEFEMMLEKIRVSFELDDTATNTETDDDTDINTSDPENNEEESVIEEEDLKEGVEPTDDEQGDDDDIVDVTIVDDVVNNDSLENNLDNTDEDVEDVVEEPNTDTDNTIADESVVIEETEAYKNLNDEFQAYKDSHMYSNEEYEALLEYKNNRETLDHQAEVDHVIDDFDDLAGVEEFRALTEKDENGIIAAYSMSVEELTEKFYALRGKYKASASKHQLDKQRKNSQTKVPLSDAFADFNADRYEGIFDLYGKK